MKKLLLLLLYASLAVAQNTVTVTASKIYANGTQPVALLPSGTAVFQATDALGNPISYQLGGGGTVVSTPITCSIKNGALQPGCFLANTATAIPSNFCYSLTIKNSANQVILGGRGSGYQCLQPTVANTWCTAAICNLDNYQPTVPQQQYTIPTPTSTTLGGIYNTLCAFGLVVNGYSSTGQPSCVAGGQSSGAVWGAITGNLSDQTDLQTALNAKAPLNSPAITGTPTAPTPGIGDNSNTLATTAYVNNFPITWGHISGNISNQADLWNYISVLAPLNSPAFTGLPTAPLQSTGDNTLLVATDAWVKLQGYAPIISPNFTGVPTAPTPSTSDSSTKIATTAWVNAQGYGVATGNVTGPVSSTVGHAALFNSTNGQQLSDAGFGFPLDKSHLGTLAPGSNGLVASAFTDTTNASNISAGTLAPARLPFPTVSTLGGVQSYTAVAQQFLTSISTGGVPVGRALASADIPNNAANTTGNAATASALGVASLLPNGTTATTQTAGDNTTNVATDAFVLANALTGVVVGQGLAVSGGKVEIATCPNGQIQQSTGTGWVCAAVSVTPSPQYQVAYYSSAGTSSGLMGNSALVFDASGNLTAAGPSFTGKVSTWSSVGQSLPTDTGAANAYVACPAAGGTASLDVGRTATFLAAHANTGASTLNWCGFGVAGLTVNGSNALVSNVVSANAVVEAKWDGTRWQCLSCFFGNSGTVSGNTVTPGAVAEYAAAGGSTVVSASASLSDAGGVLTYTGAVGIQSANGFIDNTTGNLPNLLMVPSTSGLFQYYALPQGALRYNQVVNGGPGFVQAGAADLTNGVTGSGAVVLASNATLSGTTNFNILNGVGTGSGLVFLGAGPDNSSNCGSNNVCFQAPATVTTSYTHTYAGAGPSVASMSVWSGLAGTVTTESLVPTTDTSSPTYIQTAVASAASAASGIIATYDGGGNTGSSGINISKVASGCNVTAVTVPQLCGVVNSTGLNASLANTNILTLSSAPAGQYQLSVYMNATAENCVGTVGSFAARVAYVDSNGAVTRTAGTLTFSTSLPNQQPAVITFWNQSTVSTMNVSGVWTGCGTSGGNTVDVHYALTRLQ